MVKGVPGAPAYLMQNLGDNHKADVKMTYSNYCEILFAYTG